MPPRVNNTTPLRAVPRMSWSPVNLYNLWARSAPSTPLSQETDFSQTPKSIYQQRWLAKRLTKGYHAEQIRSKKFERWYLPTTLPHIRHNTESGSAASSELSKWVEGRSRGGARTDFEARIAEMEKQASSPVGSMMFIETERRIDTLIYRACFASSIWQARSFVIDGHVKINGRKVTNANTLLNPGDIFSINPKVIPMLQKPVQKTPAEQAAEEEAEEKDVEAAVAEEAQESEVAAEASESEVTAEASETATAEASESEASEATEASEASESSESGEASADEFGKKSVWKPVVDDGGPTWTSHHRDGPLAHRDGKTWFVLPDYAQPHMFVPAYLLPSYLTCSAVYIRHPTARPGYSEIPTPFDAGGDINSGTWEWYQRVAPRMRPNRRARLMDPQRTNDRK